MQTKIRNQRFQFCHWSAYPIPEGQRIYQCPSPDFKDKWVHVFCDPGSVFSFIATLSLSNDIDIDTKLKGELNQKFISSLLFDSSPENPEPFQADQAPLSPESLLSCFGKGGELTHEAYFKLYNHKDQICKIKQQIPDPLPAAPKKSGFHKVKFNSGSKPETFACENMPQNTMNVLSYFAEQISGGLRNVAFTIGKPVKEGGKPRQFAVWDPSQRCDTHCTEMENELGAEGRIIPTKTCVVFTKGLLNFERKARKNEKKQKRAKEAGEPQAKKRKLEEQTSSD